MNSLWRTFGWGGAEARARSEALVRRTRETGAKFLSRVASSARTIQHTLRVRRERLEREPRQDLERRILAGLEQVLEALGWGLRAVAAPEPATAREAIEAERAGTELPTEAEIVSSEPPPRPAPKKRVSSRAPKPDTAKKGAKPRVRISALAPAPEKPRTKSERAEKNGRVSTRWVSPPKVDLEALMALSAKELISKLPSFDHETCRRLLILEKANKKRKTVIEALSSRLPS